MKLITHASRIIDTALDDYDGPAIPAPADFDISRMADYRVAEDGTLVLLAPTRLTRACSSATASRPRKGPAGTCGHRRSNGGQRAAPAGRQPARLPGRPGGG